MPKNQKTLIQIQDESPILDGMIQEISDILEIRKLPDTEISFSADCYDSVQKFQAKQILEIYRRTAPADKDFFVLALSMELAQHAWFSGLLKNRDDDEY